MAFKKLSEQIQDLTNPQRSDTFVRRFRDAVREGEFDAINLHERFTLPKVFNRRGAEGTYEKDMRDMAFEVTPAFEKWFTQTNEALAAQVGRGSGKPKLTMENIETGAIDFKALAEQTRQKLQSSYTKGQALGNSRKQAVQPKAKTTRAKAKK